MKNGDGDQFDLFRSDTQKELATSPMTKVPMLFSTLLKFMGWDRLATTVTRLESLACPIFAQDCEDPNPLIRALAVRTMGCIRVDKITEYLCEPLRKCLKDEDPYVRKTAAVCVAKLYDINAALVEDQGFLDQLKDLLSDSNPMVH